MGEEGLITKMSRIRFFDSLAIDLLFSGHQKYLDFIFIYLPGMMSYRKSSILKAGLDCR